MASKTVAQRAEELAGLITPIQEAAPQMKLGSQQFVKLLKEGTDERVDGLTLIKIHRGNYVETAALEKAVANCAEILERKEAEREARKAETQRRTVSRQARSDTQNAMFDAVMGVVGNYEVTPENVDTFDQLFLAAKAVHVGMHDAETARSMTKTELVTGLTAHLNGS